MAYFIQYSVFINGVVYLKGEEFEGDADTIDSLLRLQIIAQEKPAVQEKPKEEAQKPTTQEKPKEEEKEEVKK
ncbi:hypothetical protein [Helicobacter felis]|uniref:hypothetical protein n=1 Tax=Helicobacter felis TaxID=214 RepID=UPI000CF15348|nr:hypothetical protein [Helicobacter felis]